MTGSFQFRVYPWLLECFGEEIANDTVERNHRFLEEAIELVQACDMTASEAQQLVNYVYNRPVGEKPQEVGGVMVTLAALCLAQDLNMHDAGEVELERIWGKKEKIRAKQAAKPKHSPLPAVYSGSADDVRRFEKYIRQHASGVTGGSESEANYDPVTLMTHNAIGNVLGKLAKHIEMSDEDMRLHYGEMSAESVCAIRSILGLIAAADI